jgi:hypothetical protein
MNTNRIIAGGLVAGLVMNFVDFLVNALLLGQQWGSAMQARGIDPTSVPLGGTGWIIVDFIAGIFTVWLYAAIRPRFGLGPKTALIAGCVVWLISHAVFASLWFMGVFPSGLIAAASLGALVSALIAGLAGCALYKEQS